MSGFVIWRPTDSVGPSFKEATEKLQANSDITIESTATIAPLAPLAFFVEANRKGIEAAQKALPDWVIGSF